MARLAFILLVIITAGGAYVLMAPPGSQSASSPRGRQVFTVPVEIVSVTRGAFVEQEAAVGTLVSDEAVIIRSEIPGRVEKIHFDEGQHINKEALLISIEPTIYQAEHDQARARSKLSSANYERAIDLQRRGAGTQRALDEALSQMQEDEAAMDLARARLERTHIRAPFGGVLGIRKVSPGDYITPGQEIVNLEALTPIKVDFRLPETLLGRLTTGQEIEVNVDAFPDEVFSGTIYAIDPRVDSEGRSIVIRAQVPNAEGRLRPGLFARVSVVFARRGDALFVPERALVPVRNGQYVFVVVDGKAVATEVRVGGRQETLAEILSGLTYGQKIVASGQMKLRDGTPVADLNAVGMP